MPSCFLQTTTTDSRNVNKLLIVIPPLYFGFALNIAKAILINCRKALFEIEPFISELETNCSRRSEKKGFDKIMKRYLHLQFYLGNTKCIRSVRLRFEALIRFSYKLCSLERLNITVVLYVLQASLYRR